MTTTPAALLTTAAQRLREAATADYVTPGPWYVHEAYGFLRVDNDRDKTRGAWTVKTGADLAEENRGIAEYIALMHPGVALALADWLEHFAKTQFDPEASVQVTDQSHEMALAVAWQILGEVAS